MSVGALHLILHLLAMVAQQSQHGVHALAALRAAPACGVQIPWALAAGRGGRLLQSPIGQSITQAHIHDPIPQRVAEVCFTSNANASQ